MSGFSSRRPDDLILLNLKRDAATGGQIGIGRGRGGGRGGGDGEDDDVGVRSLRGRRDDGRRV